MRTGKFILSAAILMALASCAKEISPVQNETSDAELNPNLVEITLTATNESDDQDTKATFINYPKLGWEAGDMISLLGKNTGNQPLKAKSRGNVTEFTGYADVTDEVYYALYPYDENVTLTEEGVFENVTIPAVQTATAGTFDPQAYVAIAKSEDKESLHFMTVGTFIKFNFQEFPAAIKSVTLMGNNNEVLAGKAASTTFNNSGSPAHSSIAQADASYSVKLEGTFDTSKSYFMIIRPQPYSEGVTVYVELENGQVLSRKGTKRLFETGQARNSILTLTLNYKYFSDVTDLYALYNMGYDVNVGGININKATHGDAVKVVSKEKENPIDLYTALSNGGVIFLSSENEGTFKIANNTNITKDVFLIGNKSDIIMFDAGKAINFKNGTLAFKDVVVDAVNIAANQVISNYGATEDTDNFILDGCKVLNLKYPIYAINAGGNGAYKPFTCKNITFVDTDIQLAGGLSNGVINLANTTSETSMNIDFNNCIFYAGTNTTARIINNNGNLATYTSSLKFNNNTIFNLHSGVNAGILHMAGASTVEFKNNLFDFWSLNDATDDGKIEYALRIWKNNPTYTIENNHYWRRDGNTVESDKFATHGNGNSVVYAVTAASAITSGTYPFTSKVEGAGATR